MMHPVIKYAFAALLLLGATFYVNAEDTHYTEYSYAWSSCLAAKTSTYGEGCFNYSAPNPKYVQRRNNFEGLTFEKYYYYLGSCPSGMTDPDGDGQCTLAPTCVAGSDTIQSFVRLGQPRSFVSSNGCQYEWSGFEDNSCGFYQDGTLEGCNMTFTQTDNPADPADELAEDHPAQTGTPETTKSSDTGQTTYTEDPTVTNPDGSTTQTTTETTTSTAGSGAQMWNDDDYVYFRDSTGTTTVYERQKTTTTNTDGSVDETVTTTKSTQTPSTTTTTINKNTGNVTTTTNNYSTTNNTTTVTNNYYDSNGNLTGSDSTTTGGTETENEGDENKEGNCGAPGQPKCEISLEGEDYLTDPSGQFTEPTAVLDERLQYIENITDNDITENLLEFTPVDLHAGNTCDPTVYSSEYKGATFSPFYGFCQFYDSDMRPILAFFFYCMTAFGCYFIWVTTMRGSA